MHNRKSIAHLVSESMTQDSQNIVNFKIKSNLIKNFENTDSKTKKNEWFLENGYFVPWVSVDYELDLIFTETRYEKWLVSMWIKKQ